MLPAMLAQRAPQSLQPALQLAVRVSTRWLETLVTPQHGPGSPLAPTTVAVPPKSAAKKPDAAPQRSSSQQTDNVLGVLTSLLQQQQQAGPHRQHAAQQQETPTASNSAAAAAAMQWPPAAAAGSEMLSSAACQSDLAAASSGQVRMESQLVFDSCWRRFRDRRGMDFAAPREIVWLNGAPGSGKGVSAPHIQAVRGMTKSICVSSLLTAAPEARHSIATGEMITDATVGDLLLEELLQPASAGMSTAELNAVVDGFPRTAVQVDFVKLLMDKLMRLHRRFVDTPLAAQFPRPAFKVVVLYVDEATSIQRQLQRAVVARAHNARVKDAGVSEQARLQEERPTDLDLDKATKRYLIFKQHYSAILRLKQFLPFHLIDAMGSKQDTQEQITQELRYQSSLDLSEEAYNAIRHLPLAKDLQQTARQQLVGRLEHYCQQQRPLFGHVLGVLQGQVLPLLQQGALAGSAEWVTQEGLFSQHPVCVDMLLDVLADRGFKATYCRETLLVPVALDSASGNITVKQQPQHRFRFSLEQAGEREASMLKALEIAARITEAARSNMVAAARGSDDASLEQQLQQPHAVVAGLHPAAPITESFIPDHMNHEAKAKRAQDLRRVTLTALSRQSLRYPFRASASASPASSPSAAAAGAAAAANSCGSQPGCGGSCSGGQQQQGGEGGEQEEGVYTIHRCVRPELNCGHAEELEVVAASG